MNELSTLYAAWVKAQGFELACTEELLCREDLSEYQTSWLNAFEKLWEVQQAHEDAIAPHCLQCGFRTERLSAATLCDSCDSAAEDAEEVTPQ